MIRKVIKWFFTPWDEFVANVFIGGGTFYCSVMLVDKYDVPVGAIAFGLFLMLVSLLLYRNLTGRIVRKEMKKVKQITIIKQTDTDEMKIGIMFGDDSHTVWFNDEIERREWKVPGPQWINTDDAPEEQMMDYIMKYTTKEK